VTPDLTENDRCASCGFLALRIKESRELVAAEHAYRSHGALPQVGDHHTYEPYPECFKRALDLERVIGKIDGPQDSRIWEVIQDFRKCKSYRAWDPSKSPKEHDEMAIPEQVRNENRQFQEDERAEMAKYRQEDAKNRAESERRQRSHNFWMTVLYVVGTLAASIIGGLITAHWK
jgi:hypothetical protein